MNVMVGSLCLLLSVPWVPMEPKVDTAVRLSIHEVWQAGLEADKEGLSPKESFDRLYKEIKVLEQEIGREKMILQCALIAVDTMDSARKEVGASGSGEVPRAYMQALVTLERLIEATPRELVELLGPYWPIEDGTLRYVLTEELFDLAIGQYRDKSDESDENVGWRAMLMDLFSSVLGDAWSRGDAKYNGLIDYMYSKYPAEAWQTMAEVDDVKRPECQALTTRLLPVQTVYRGYHIRNPDRLPEGTQDKARAILYECLECGSLWSKIFVAEVLLRVESMHEEDLLKVLRVEQSPFIVRRLKMMEQEKKHSN